MLLNLSAHTGAMRMYVCRRLTLSRIRNLSRIRKDIASIA